MAKRRRPPQPSKPPNLPASSTIRRMDLYGRTPDGRLKLWDRDRPVLPVTSFELDGPWIKSGHYVINDNSDAVTVHCGNMTSGNVSVLTMCGGLGSRSVPRKVIEPLLLGWVVRTEEDVERDVAAINALFDWIERRGGQ